MFMHSADIPQEDRLDLSFQGSLVVTLALNIIEIGGTLPPHLSHSNRNWSEAAYVKQDLLARFSPGASTANVTLSSPLSRGRH